MSTLRLNPRLLAATTIAAVAVTPAVAVAAMKPAQNRPGAPRAMIADVNRQIYLKGGGAYRAANGSAQYQAQPGQRELQIELQRARPLAGRTVTFWVGGSYFGSARVSRFGQADIDRNTERGQAVPTLAQGTYVAVKTASGKLIVSGTF
jgi:hypothetical protein